MLNSAYITIGLPGSGKSTWSRDKAKKDNLIIVCRDALRTMVKNEYIFDKDLESLVASMANACIKEAILDSRSIIIDETNLTKSIRASWLQLCPRDYKKYFVWFKETEKNLDRRMQEHRGISRENGNQLLKT